MDIVSVQKNDQNTVKNPRYNAQLYYFCTDKSNRPKEQPGDCVNQAKNLAHVLHIKKHCTTLTQLQ